MRETSIEDAGLTIFDNMQIVSVEAEATTANFPRRICAASRPRHGLSPAGPRTKYADHWCLA